MKPGPRCPRTSPSGKVTLGGGATNASLDASVPASPAPGEPQAERTRMKRAAFREDIPMRLSPTRAGETSSARETR